MGFGLQHSPYVQGNGLVWSLSSRVCVCFMQMEGMLKDLQLAREKQQKFEEWQGEQNKPLGIDLVVTVLTTGFWPTYKVHIRSLSSPPFGCVSEHFVKCNSDDLPSSEAAFR